MLHMTFLPVRLHREPWWTNWLYLSWPGSHWWWWTASRRKRLLITLDLHLRSVNPKRSLKRRRQSHLKLRWRKSKGNSQRMCLFRLPRTWLAPLLAGSALFKLSEKGIVLRSRLLESTCCLPTHASSLESAKVLAWLHQNSSLYWTGLRRETLCL